MDLPPARPRPSPPHLHTWPLRHPVVTSLVSSCPRPVSRAGLEQPHSCRFTAGSAEKSAGSSAAVRLACSVRLWKGEAWREEWSPPARASRSSTRSPRPGPSDPLSGIRRKRHPPPDRVSAFLLPKQKKKPVKEEWRKNELGRAMSPQLCGRQTLPTRLLPPRRRGRAVTGWGELAPPTAPTGTRTRGCRSSGLEHRTVAARRFYFQAKTRQHPLDKGC